MNAELARLIVGHVFLHACMAGMRLAAPLWALREGYSEVAVGALLALFALTQVFLALPAGRFADRNGIRRPLAIAVCVSCLSVLVPVLWPGMVALALMALATGGATGLAAIALQRHVGRLADDTTQLKQVFSWLALGPAISNFVGPFTAGFLIDHAGFQWAFVAMGLLPLITWACVRGARELPLPPTLAQTSVTGKNSWDLLHQPMLRRLLGVNWILSSCWDVHTFVVPILGHERGFSASTIGTILGAFAVAAAAVRVLMPLVAERLNERTVIVGAMLNTAVMFGLYPLLHSPWLMGVCSVLLGLGLGAVQPMVMSLLHQITPPARHGEALGLRLMAINASSVVMPLMFGGAGTLLGLSVVFWTGAAAVGLGAKIAAALGAEVESEAKSKERDKDNPL